jgi:CBS domain-containing protein
MIRCRSGERRIVVRATTPVRAMGWLYRTFLVLPASMLLALVALALHDTRRRETELAQDTDVVKVEDIMTVSPVTCRPDDSLSDAARAMWDHDCGCVPVVEGDGEPRAVGIITDRDICMCAYSRGLPLGELRVHDAMARNPCTCSPFDSIETAERLMRDAQVRRLPVVDAAGTVVGILSLADIAREADQQPKRRRGLSDKDVGDTLASIVRPHAGRSPTRAL